MKRFFLIPAFTLLFVFCNSQEKSDTLRQVYPNNSIYLELGGNSIYFGSVNYERILLHRKFFYLSVRGGIGGGYIPIPPSESMISFPLLINSIFQVHHKIAIEAGSGHLLDARGNRGGRKQPIGDMAKWKCTCSYRHHRFQIPGEKGFPAEDELHTIHKLSRDILFFRDQLWI